MDHTTTYAVDLAKSVFEIAVSNRPGHVHERHRLARDRFLPFFAHREPATVLLEACGSAHHWSRELGVFIPLGAQRVRPAIAELLEDADSGVPQSLRPALADSATEISELERLRGHNKAAVALASKLARIAWAVWKHQRPYERRSSTSLPPSNDCWNDTVLMASRSDRRGAVPITGLALEAVPNDCGPARDFHHGRETSHVSPDEAEDTNAVRPATTPVTRHLREESRYASRMLFEGLTDSRRRCDRALGLSRVIRVLSPEVEGGRIRWCGAVEAAATGLTLPPFASAGGSDLENWWDRITGRPVSSATLAEP